MPSRTSAPAPASGGLNELQTSRHTTCRFIDGRWCISYDDGEIVTLIHSKHEVHSMQDFHVQIRPSMDLRNLLNNQKAIFLLDLVDTEMESIMNAVLIKLVESNENLKGFKLEEAKASLLLNNNGYMFSQTIQGLCSRHSGQEVVYDQSWICAIGEIACLENRCVAIARLQTTVNLGNSCCGARFVIVVLCPCKEKGTKTALETGLTFATLFADANFRRRLLAANTEAKFAAQLREQGEILALEFLEKQEKQVNNRETIINVHQPSNSTPQQSNEKVAASTFEKEIFSFMEGIREDFLRRWKFYLSDFVDGVRGENTINKMISTTLFLYFACLLPAIAFGSLNDNNTDGKLNVQKVIFGQMLGGIFFSLLGGQPLLILLTTAPLSLYTKIVYEISRQFQLDFFAFFAAVGLFNSFFVICYAIFDLSKIMKWCTRSTVEIFALFITIAFFVDAFTHVIEDFDENYNIASCFKNGTQCSTLATGVHHEFHSLVDARMNYSMNDTGTNAPTLRNNSMTSALVDDSVITGECNRAGSVLHVLLMFSTLWLGLFLYNFNKTPYLQTSRRELLADYSLPIAVIFVSFLGSHVFQDVKLEQFKYTDSTKLFELARLETLPFGAIVGAAGLGFCLSLLFFMDQNISAAMVNNPNNRLKKGPAYHLDLLVVAVLNAVLSVFCLPWMHAAIPHCPLHVRSLADVEERVEHGMIYQIIVKVRETRLTALISHILIGLSLFLLPFPLAYIPNAVLDGLFLYVAVTGLYGNQLFDRILLLFTEQTAYPPNHYIRRVPQRKVHMFTFCQIIQLGILCLAGFFPWVYLKIAFPVILFLLIPIRFFLIPRIVTHKFLQPLDGEY